MRHPTSKGSRDLSKRRLHSLEETMTRVDDDTRRGPDQNGSIVTILKGAQVRLALKGTGQDRNDW